MYTVLVTDTRGPYSMRPAICFDTDGKSPYITNNWKDAHEYMNELERMFPECKYKVMEICDV